MILDDYIAACLQYEKQYGKNTAILMQIGDFFELYAIINDEEQVGADIYAISNLCNLQVSRKNKSNIECSRQNPLMAGFPLYILNKHVQTLVAANYTAVIIRQVTPPPNVTRAVSEIVSPSTYLLPSGYENPYLFVMHWTCTCRTKAILAVGMAWIDLTTGESTVYEVGSHESDVNYAKDEAYRLVKTLRPKEIVICGDNDIDMDIAKGIIEHLQIPGNVCVHEKWNIEQFTNAGYQRKLLEKVYGGQNKSMLSVVDFLGIGYYQLACTAFCVLLQFAFNHNETILDNLKKCIIHNNNDKLQLQYNSALQLGMISYNPMEKPLMDILNRCSTSFGKRRFVHYLLNPSCSSEWLNKRYALVEDLIVGDKWKVVSKKLSGISDLQRILRKIALQTLPPCDWNGFHMSLCAANEAFTFLGNDDVCKRIVEIQAHYEAVLNIDEASKYLLNDVKGNIFMKGVCSEIDEIDDQLKHDTSIFQGVADVISNTSDGNGTLCRFECNDREGHHLLMTATRWKLFLKNKMQPQIDVMGCIFAVSQFETRAISSQSNMLRIQHPILRTLSTRIFEHRRILGDLVVKRYKRFLKDFLVVGEDALDVIVNEVGELDIHATNAQNAVEFCYSKPVLMDGGAGVKSSVDIKGLRHPIIERLGDTTLYVKNDVHLGMDGLNGMLLYGVNSSGKSSLMKAVGLSIIMAQAGMFVPATIFNLTPFKKLFTRISGADNIYRGMSTFVVEMSELRNILLRCDAQSVVLGDELCAGTESVSATAIVSSGIHYLASANASFIFATHLHELHDASLGIEMPPSVENYYMHVEFDDQKKIIYDRILKKGVGSRFYGLEVCNGIDMPLTFLDHANIIRKKLMGVADNLLEHKQSRYNARACVESCKVCGKPATEVHHINYQEEANGRGQIEHYHKNVVANLVALCEQCHVKEHTGKIKISGYVQTSHGVELNIEGRSNIDMCVSEDQDQELKKTIKYTPRGWFSRANKRGRWKEVSEEHIWTLLENKNKLKNLKKDFKLEDWKSFLSDPLY